jgi:membrane-associated protein
VSDTKHVQTRIALWGGVGHRLCEDAGVPSWLDFEQVADWVSAAWWSYPLISTVAAVDAFFPLVPSETVVVIGGTLASSGSLSLPLVILVAAAGAIAGDNISYGIGTLVGERTVKRWFGSTKWHARLEWAERTLDERGAYIIIIGRFIPGGRTAVTFSSGYIPTFPWRRFIVYDVAAATLWATYAGLLGYFGGKTFEKHPTLGLVMALGIALSLGLLVETIRHLRQRRRSGVE